MVAMVVGIYGFMAFWFARENRKRDERVGHAAHEGMTDEEFAELGDESPHFRYTIRLGYVFGMSIMRCCRL